MKSRFDQSGDGWGLAIAAFIVILFAIMLILHFLQPAGQKTIGSSRSPTHETTD